MQTHTEVWSDRWWKFDRYQVVGGRIRPAPGARLSRYDPWALRAPYVELGRLGEAVSDWYDREVLPSGARFLKSKMPLLEQLPPGEIADILREAADALSGEWAEPPEELSQALGEWCARFGLLGIFQHETLLLNLEVRAQELLEGFREIPTEAQLLESLPRYERVGSGWHELSLRWRTKAERAESLDLPRRQMGELLASSPWPLDESSLAPAQVLGRSPGQARRGLPETWGLKDLAQVRRAYLPDWPGPGFPAPNSKVFWRVYSESAVEFFRYAVGLADALSALGQESSKTRSAGLETLNSLLSGVSLVVDEDDKGKLTTHLASPSLIGTLAAMAYSDIAGGLRFGHCEYCQGLFASRRTDRRFCSPGCQDTAKKKRQRAKLA